ncbi:primary-amine oxidase [Pseudonocardia sp. DSM 110487]|uniref:primary-amine oxidase n=1 Tax=Pseudonocardia sp. DSM 110487 TaxID=2865833 RepID=UPI001C6A5F84|nr:primary-amine oxidase [Pseudonocardia sp. DSM 110487]QYN33504.1 primary-amine oxidase [Pseudonocardia sp. DSM 110487]
MDSATVSRLAHPLDPLSAEEVEAAAAVVRDSDAAFAPARFVSIGLDEPAKDQVLASTDGAEIDRRAFMVVRDPRALKTYEAVVSLTHGEVVSIEHVPEAQTALTEEDFLAVERLLKADERWQDAMRKRGVTDFEHVMIDPWPAAYLTEEDAPARRLNRPLTFVRNSADENGYAHPVEGLLALVDLDRGEVLEVTDHDVVDIPPAPGEYTTTGMRTDGNFPHFDGPRTDLKPLEITQPEGPSFEVDGYEVRWQKWRFRVGFTPREGLVLHTLGYEDRGTLRSVLHRASIAEMVVPYGDPAPTHTRKSVFDGGEDGLGVNVNSLTLGCDCLGQIFYFDAVLSTLDGTAQVVENAICMHEEDYGVLWKHTDFRTGNVEVRRSRRLVISSFMTLANYDYGFFWYLYQDGTIQCEVKLTGIMSMGAHRDGEVPTHGVRCAPGLYAPHHQHFFCARLDMAVDGCHNTVIEVDSVPDPLGDENPYGNAWHTESTPLTRESEAQRDIDATRARYWKIVNEQRLNHVGDPVGYKLMPGENVHHMFHPDAPAFKRAGFVGHHLWVTQYAPRERYAAGDYPYQSRGGAGLPEYVQQDRALRGEDVVVWYTFGAHHVARPEDWPVMPVSYVGFHLKPSGFFDGNPALDVPASQSACHTG